MHKYVFHHDKPDTSCFSCYVFVTVNRLWINAVICYDNYAHMIWYIWRVCIFVCMYMCVYIIHNKVIICLQNIHSLIWRALYICVYVHVSIYNTDQSNHFSHIIIYRYISQEYPQIAKFMGPIRDPPGSCRPQMGPMLAPWTLLSGSTAVLLTDRFVQGRSILQTFFHVMAQFSPGETIRPSPVTETSTVFSRATHWSIPRSIIHIILHGRDKTYPLLRKKGYTSVLPLLTIIQFMPLLLSSWQISDQVYSGVQLRNICHLQLMSWHGWVITSHGKYGKQLLIH